jgi:outer membrane lipoprotein-sorting protein
MTSQLVFRRSAAPSALICSVFALAACASAGAPLVGTASQAHYSALLSCPCL